MQQLLAIALATLFALLGVATPADAPVRTAGTVQVVDTTPDYAAWTMAQLDDAGFSAEGIAFEYTDGPLNCGSALSPSGVGGGCTHELADGSYLIVISPSAIENGTGLHILMHEYAHTLDLGECAAEYFAKQFVPAEDWSWSYPKCA